MIPQGGEAACAQCDLIFGSITTFDWHITRGHLGPQDMGLHAAERGSRVVWVRDRPTLEKTEHQPVLIRRVDND